MHSQGLLLVVRQSMLQFHSEIICKAIFFLKIEIINYSLTIEYIETAVTATSAKGVCNGPTHCCCAINPVTQRSTLLTK